MDEHDPLEHAGSRATDLIADFHARHEAWRRQGENLERLRADARAAAAVEAAAILTAARGDVRRIIVDARRALLVLTAQLQAITQGSGGQADDDSSHQGSGEDVPYSVLQARRDLARLLSDMRPELDDLTAQTEQFDEPQVSVSAPVAAEPVLVPAVEINDVEHDAALAAIAPLFEHELDVDRVAEDVPAAPAAGHTPAGPRSGLRFGIRGTAIVVAVLGMTVLGGGGWWLSRYVRAEGLAPPLASIPRAQTPEWWQTEAMPTLTASLVALPAAATVRSAMTAPNAVSLDVEMRRAAWVECVVDGGLPISRTFQAGETFQLLGNRGISITVRDAGAVVVSLNGGPRGPLGPDGQVLSRHFMPGDAVSP
jgi:RodZ C-terminal domain